MMFSFINLNDDPSIPVTSDLETDSDRLLIAFGGIKGFKIIPPFEFVNLTQEIPTKKIFIRDMDQAWYQNGLTGIAKDADGIASYLRETINAHSIRRTVMIGNSMGGYAAILFGAMLGADAVIAFAPQTYLTFAKRLLTLDIRWIKQIQKARKANTNPLYLDLANVLKKFPPRGSYHLYYSAYDYFDVMHALNLRGTNVQLHRFQEGGHKLVKHLRDSGELKKILIEALI